VDVLLHRAKGALLVCMMEGEESEAGVSAGARACSAIG
jgi:hypothetical protein